MRSVLLDTNLLVLLVVGAASAGYIKKHKCTDNFTIDDFELLIRLLSQFQQIVATPHTLTETSNLLNQSHGRMRDEIMACFHGIIGNVQEELISSKMASSEAEFLRLGLTDAALLALNLPPSSLLTADANLYHSAVSRGQDAHNFHHYREAEGIA